MSRHPPQQTTKAKQTVTHIDATEFGLVLIGAALSHIQLNARSIATHVKERSAALTGAVLVAALVSAYAILAMNPIPPEIAEPLDKAADRAENRGSAIR